MYERHPSRPAVTHANAHHIEGKGIARPAVSTMQLSMNAPVQRAFTEGLANPEHLDALAMEHAGKRAEMDGKPDMGKQVYDQLMASIGQLLPGMPVPRLLSLEESEENEADQGPETVAAFQQEKWAIYIQPLYRNMVFNTLFWSGLAAKLLHEIRHAEQHFKAIVQLLREHTNPATIAEQMEVPEVVVAAIAENFTLIDAGWTDRDEAEGRELITQVPQSHLANEGTDVAEVHLMGAQMATETLHYNAAILHALNGIMEQYILTPQATNIPIILGTWRRQVLAKMSELQRLIRDAGYIQLLNDIDGLTVERDPGQRPPSRWDSDDEEVKGNQIGILFPKTSKKPMLNWLRNLSCLIEYCVQTGLLET